MEEIRRDPVTGRAFFVIDVANVDDFPEKLSLPSHHFVCLIAWDATHATDAEITKLADQLHWAGCVYVCCWGPDCERVHDAFDLVDIDLRPDGPWRMSTWHSKEPLGEAIWFSMFSASPVEEFADSCKSIVGLSIGCSTWASEMREAFAAPDEFNARILAAVEDEE